MMPGLAAQPCLLHSSPSDGVPQGVSSAEPTATPAALVLIRATRLAAGVQLLLEAELQLLFWEQPSSEGLAGGNGLAGGAAREVRLRPRHPAS